MCLNILFVGLINYMLRLILMACMCICFFQLIFILNTLTPNKSQFKRCLSKITDGKFMYCYIKFNVVNMPRWGHETGVKLLSVKDKKYFINMTEISMEGWLERLFKIEDIQEDKKNSGRHTKIKIRDCCWPS